MAILATDIKNYESERMTENSDGGGLITGTVISCATVNNIFPNISRIDRLYGRTQFRKIFPKVTTDTFPPETYSGAHIIISAAPEDQYINMILFDTGTNVDERSDMITFFTDYFQKGVVCGTATTAYQAEIGAEALVFLTEDVDKWKVYEYDELGQPHWYWLGTATSYTLPVNPGEVIAVGNEFLHVVKVDIERSTAAESASYMKTKYRTYTVLYLATPTTEQHVIGTQVFTRKINPDWCCYGTMTLSSAVSPGEINIPVNSEKVRVVPTVNMPVEVSSYPVYVTSTVANGISLGVSPNQFTMDGILQPYISYHMAVEVGQLVYVEVVDYPAIVAGSVHIYYRAQGRWEFGGDDGLGALRHFCSGTVDYATGTVSMTLNKVADENTRIFILYRTAQNYVEQTNVPIGAPGTPPTITLNFTQTNIMEGTVFFDIETADGIFPIVDSNGSLVPNPNQFLKRPPDFYDTTYACSVGTGVQLGSTVYYDNAAYWWWAGNGVDRAMSPNGYEWFYSNLDPTEPFGSPDNKRVAFDDSDMCMMVGLEKLCKRDNPLAIWEDLAPDKPVPADDFSDITWFSNPGIGRPSVWVVCAYGDTQRPIFSENDGTTWAYSDTDIMSMFRIHTGVQQEGTPMCIGVGEYAWYTTDPAAGAWSPLSGAVLGTKCVAVDCANDVKTWMIAAAGRLIRHTNGGLGGGMWEDMWPALQLLPEIAGRDIVDLACSPSGQWVVCFDSQGVTDYLAISGDNGDHWVIYEPDFGTWGDADMDAINAVCYNPDDDAFVHVMVSSADNALFRSNLLLVRKYPYSPVGTIDYAAGTGAITAGDPIITSITCDYFLTELEYKDFGFPLMISPPVATNTLAITALQKNTNVEVSIAELGGVPVGDGTFTLNHEHAYVYGSFDDPIELDSMQLACIGTALYHPQYDEYDTTRMPTDGFVPACKAGDTIVISEGYQLPYDNLAGGVFEPGDVIVGATTGTTWVVIADDNSGTTGTLTVANKVEGTGPLGDGEQIDNGGGVTADVNSVTGVTYAYDACIVVKVTKNLITVAVEDGLVNSYPAGTLVSAAVVAGDLQATAGTYFNDSSWPGWFDTQQIGPAGGSWDSTNYPAEVTNNGATTERWSLIVTAIDVPSQSVQVTITGEFLGIMATGVEIKGAAPTDVSITNLNSVGGAAKYFTIPYEAWQATGAGSFANGDVFRFNTIGAEYPLWVCRSINARTSDQASDRTVIETRGDVST